MYIYCMYVSMYLCMFICVSIYIYIYIYYNVTKSDKRQMGLIALKNFKNKHTYTSNKFFMKPTISNDHSTMTPASIKAT